ncbi:hypothetical protein FRC09_014166 [Ceratobasidium sp. 395]|nr:hypothetical protein FRC09_014166 [Ceratobasidium sp. 395]
MSGLYSEYRALFSIKTRQRGRPTALSLSPTGRWLCSASDYGDLLIQRASQDYIYCHVRMDRSNHVTAVIWATDFQIILGCFNGVVYVATLITNPTPDEDRIKIRGLISDIVSPIRALAYDSNRKMIALGYPGHVSVWRWAAGEYRKHVWRMVDIFATKISGTSAGVNSLHFFGADKALLLGLDSGVMIWRGTGELKLVNMGLRACRIGAAAVSSDDSFMAISTLDRSIFIWPLSPQGPTVSLTREYLLESGLEWHKFEPHTPVAVTSNLCVVCGTLDGIIAVLSQSGICLQKIENG